jgi:uncharacterized phage-like protein YoqJ
MTTDKSKTLAFSGHRSEKLPQTKEGLNALRKRLGDEIDRAIRDGYTDLIMGACYGFDLMAADEVIARKHKTRLVTDPPIRLIAAVPYENQAEKWKESDREIYYNTLALCDEVITLQTHYSKGVFYARNRWMVDRASRLIAYSNGSGGTGYTVTYAEKNGLDIVNLRDLGN